MPVWDADAMGRGLIYYAMVSTPINEILKHTHTKKQVKFLYRLMFLFPLHIHLVVDLLGFVVILAVSHEACITALSI